MSTAITCSRAPAALGPYSQAVRNGGRLYVSGQLGIDPASGKMPESFAAQAKQSLENAAQILAEAGFSPENVVKTTIFVDDMNNFDLLNTVYANYFTAHKPARSCVQVAALPKGAKVEIELIAEKDL